MVPYVEKKIRLHRCSLMKGDMFMNDDRNSKYDIAEDGRTFGYDKKGGWDIDTSDRTWRESDGGHIPSRYQWCKH